MKTTTFIITLTGAALFTFGSPVFAQGYKATGDDGITASPKLREQLNNYALNYGARPAPAPEKEMACPKCKNIVTTRVDTTSRGVNKPTLIVVTHQCSACGTEWKTENKQAVSTHTCQTSCGSKDTSCCATSKDSKAPTKGMQN